MAASKEVKGCTHTYYQVLIDARDIPHIVSVIRPHPGSYFYQSKPQSCGCTARSSHQYYYIKNYITNNSTIKRTNLLAFLLQIINVLPIKITEYYPIN